MTRGNRGAMYHERLRLNELVSSEEWLEEQHNRLLGWDIMVSCVRCEQVEEMKVLDICDRIGIKRSCVDELIVEFRKRLL